MTEIAEAWLAPHQQTMTAFSSDIEHCIGHADWEKLEQVLVNRQSFLETLAELPMPDACRNSLKRYLQDLLEQDARYVALIEAQKSSIAQQQASLEAGRRAVQAYTNF
ncbi:MAG: hypothetical protein RL563_1590 [Pseudomonadota bacterium]